MDTVTSSVPRSASRPGMTLRATEDLATSWIAAGKLLGVQVFAARSHTLIGDVAVGWSEPSRPAEPSDVARLYCNAKPLVTVCLAQAVEEGLLDWDDPISRFLPVADTPQHRAMTIRSLLTHSSGLPWVSDDPYQMGFARLLHKATQEQLPPWTWFPVPAYNTTLAWHVLAAVLQVVREKPADVVVRERISDSLGLPTLTLTGPIDESAYVALHSHSRPHVFQRSPGPAVHALATTLNPAHGGVATVADLGAFYQELLRCAGGVGRLLAAPTMAEILRPQAVIQTDGRQSSRWGLGMGVDFAARTLAGAWSGQTFGHRGTIGIRTVVVAFADPERDVAGAIRLFSLDGRSSWRIWALAGALIEDVSAPE
jgi:CubicO group peptidase (beta-lactamase class C family)